MDDFMATNRANWDERVPIHLASRFYDVDGWLRERPGPRSWELHALGEVSGLDVIHLQCHFGLDTLALAMAGAQVTGLDFSGVAIAEGRALADRAGLAHCARFVQADVLCAAEVLSPERYDLVYVSLGALCWLPNVSRWAAQVAALLRPGGRLYLHDGHPLAWALADDDLRVEHSYFEQAEPYAGDAEFTYTDGDVRLTNTRPTSGTTPSARSSRRCSTMASVWRCWSSTTGPSGRGSRGWSRPSIAVGKRRPIDRGCR